MILQTFPSGLRELKDRQDTAAQLQAAFTTSEVARNFRFYQEAFRPTRLSRGSQKHCPITQMRTLEKAARNSLAVDLITVGGLLTCRMRASVEASNRASPLCDSSFEEILRCAQEELVVSLT